MNQQPRSEAGSLPHAGSWRATDVLLGIVVILGLAPQARAEEHQKVNIVLAGEAAGGEKVLAVLQESLGRQGVDVVASIVPRLNPLQQVRAPVKPAADRPVVYLWLDLAARQPTMYLVSAASGLVYVRSLAVRANLDAVGIELIRFVVDSSVQAILTGRALGISRDEFERTLKTESSIAPADAAARMAEPEAPRPPTPTAISTAPPAPASGTVRPDRPDEPPPAPATIETAPAHTSPAYTSPTPGRGAIIGAYGGTRLASDFVQHGPQLTAELRLSQIHLGIAVAQTFPLTVVRDDVHMRLLSSSVRAFTALPVTLGAEWAASFGLGVGLDATHVTPGGVGATSPFWVSDPLARAMGVVERVFGALIASAELGIDWDLLAARYSATRSAGTVTLWTPQRWRPYAALRLGFLF